MQVKNITIGADPELFIINSKTGKVVSSIGLIPGVKGEPYVSEDMPNGFGLETDNILAEFNIPPVKDCVSFINNILYMQEYIRNFVKGVNPDLDIKCSASEIVDADQLKSDEAQEFGCSASYNVYTESENPKPEVPKDGMRSCGFHIHWGYDNPNTQTSLNIIKLFDAFVTVPSIILDGDKRRREIYGKAGEFRLTDYGCEARSLSSYMQSSPELLEKIWKGIERVKAELEYPTVRIERYQKHIIDCINNSDVELARQLCKTFKIDYV